MCLGLSLPARLRLPLPEWSNLIKYQPLKKIQLFSRCCLPPQMEAHLGDRRSVARASRLQGCGEERDSGCGHYGLRTIIHHTPPPPSATTTWTPSLSAGTGDRGGPGSVACWFSLRTREEERMQRSPTYRTPENIYDSGK